MSDRYEGPLERIDKYRWRIPQTYMPGMLVPGIIYASAKLLEHIRMDKTPLQVANVAHLPGIVKASLAMPDIHWGYGLPIGGVAAVSVEDGVISPGGVGSDINCGVRLLATNIESSVAGPKIKELADTLFRNIPCGIGSSGNIKLNKKDQERVLSTGARWAVESGFGWDEDLLFTENQGVLDGGERDSLGPRALQRGVDQLGTLGAGNHFTEVQVIEEVFDDEAAGKLGLRLGHVAVMVHSGSRGLGYQVCEDNVRKMGKVMGKYGISLPDRQLACAPLDSSEGKRYLSAMAAAANYAWANRQCLAHLVRESFSQVFGKSSQSLGMHMLYDVAHNIAKFETHVLDEKKIDVLVHRKGATRAYGPGNEALPEKYRGIGQPVIIPGDMGSSSYVLLGTDRAMEETFGSTCHGAGRQMSRTKARKASRGRNIPAELGQKGILVRAHGKKTLEEEIPDSYKDVDEVVDVVEGAGISRKVARLRPLAVIKG
jgi:tRNA-splicing ligase RtcB